LSRSAVALSSTPSATLEMPQVSASSITDWTIAAARGSRRIGATNCRSSLISSIGSSRRYVIAA
jgi:hypothetical protein